MFLCYLWIWGALELQHILLRLLLAVNVSRDANNHTGVTSLKCSSENRQKAPGPPEPYLQCLEDSPAIGGQLGVRRLAEELGKGSDGVELVC